MMLFHMNKYSDILPDIDPGFLSDNYLAFYLTYILSFYLPFFWGILYQSVWHSISAFLSVILSDVHSVPFCHIMSYSIWHFSDSSFRKLLCYWHRVQARRTKGRARHCPWLCSGDDQRGCVEAAVDMRCVCVRVSVGLCPCPAGCLAKI